MENSSEIQQQTIPENLLNDKNLLGLLHTGVRQFNSIVMESNSKNPDANIDDTLDNLTLMDDVITDLDEFSEYAIREQIGKNSTYHINIAPKNCLHEKNGKLMLDFADGPVKEVQIKITELFGDPLNNTPDRVMARTGYGIEFYVSEASYNKDENNGQGKVSFKILDGIKVNVMNDGNCILQGRKYAGDLGYVAEKSIRLDTLPNMTPVIQGVQNQFKAAKLF